MQETTDSDPPNGDLVASIAGLHATALVKRGRFSDDAQSSKTSISGDFLIKSMSRVTARLRATNVEFRSGTDKRDRLNASMRGRR